ncbi:MAG: S-layer homology domain-containing protein [Acidimicrobiia bacterium]
MSASRSVRRRLVAVGAALAVLVTLFPAVGSAAVVEACPTSLPSAGYKDLGGLSAEAIDAIDCITHYGIATGTSSTNFTPAGEVARWQMALFLVRMADDLGIVVPTVTTSNFDDISGYPIDTQRAINQLAQMGITAGVAPRTFDPAGVVPRWQMALFLTRMHAKAGYTLPSGASMGFTDITNYPATTQVAINQLAQLGIAKGTSTTTFSPGTNVFRWQMALFLARQLQAGGASPYDISVSLDPATAPTSNSVTATVTVLTPDGKPVVGRLVDVFVGTLDSAGRCVLDTDAKIGTSDAGTSTNCTIDNSDPKTNTSGKVSVVLTHNSTIETDRVFAWIGSSGQVFDTDVVSLYAFADLVWTAQPTAIVVPAKVVKFGTNATVTGWLADAGGNVVAASGFRVVVTVTRNSNQIIAQTLTTNSSGLFSFSYTGPSDPDSGNPSAEIVDTVKAFWDKDADGVDDGAAELDVTSTVTWDDDDPRADTAVLGQNSVSGLAGHTVTLTATVKDKFGAPISGASVVFTITGVNAQVLGAVTTNSSGVATSSYTATNLGSDTIDAAVDVDGGGDDILAAQIADLSHYTVEVAPDLPGETTFNVVAVNTSANTIDVVAGASYYRLAYDSNNDTFTINGVGSKTISEFETALSGLSLPATGKLKTNPYDADSSAATAWILTT